MRCSVISVNVLFTRLGIRTYISMMLETKMISMCHFVIHRFLKKSVSNMSVKLHNKMLGEIKQIEAFEAFNRR
jgi:hypothetical protein